MHTTEAIDRLFLELSQFTQARTGRELELERRLKLLVDLLDDKTADCIDNDGRPYQSQALANAIEGARAAPAPLYREDGGMSDWQSMETAPLGTPIMVRMETDRIEGGVWVATAILHEDCDHWTDGATILHYNRNVLVKGFRGPLTGWMPLPAPLTAWRAE